MLLCRFTNPGVRFPRYGFVERGEVFPLEPFSFDMDRIQADDAASLEAYWLRRAGTEQALSDARLFAPVAPSKIICVGRNYREHAAELGNPMPAEPLLFSKPPSSLVGPDAAIELPPESERVEHEGELGVVIGRRARRLSEADDPLAYVFGYTCVNDVTARDLQRKDVQFTRAKGFDTFCPVGPYVATGLDPADLLVETRVNGETRQSGRTSAMAFPVPFLIRYISHIMTLEPGDLISTGTPAGVGPLRDGDTVEVEVEEVGVLRNPVRARAGGPAV